MFSSVIRRRHTVALTLSLIASAACRNADAKVALPPAVLGADLATSAGRDTAVFAAGCFWGVEAVYRHVKGMISSTSGYAGGSAKNADYELVSQGTTGHAESVQVIYDPSQVSYAVLLQVFFSVAHDPTQLNRQGPDVGPQYRSAIFYANAAQQRSATAYIAQLTEAKAFRRPIVTQVVPLEAFYRAEDYHQNYLALHPNQPYIVFNDLPKIKQLREQFPELYR